MAITEVHIGTDFGIEDYKPNFTSAIARATSDTFELALLLDFEEPGIPQISPSRRDDILLKCADVIIDFMQILKSVHGEHPNSTISINLEDLEESYNANLKAQFNGIAVLFTTVNVRYYGIVEASLENIAEASLLTIKHVCLIPAMLGEADLEPYILERISEHNK